MPRLETQSYEYKTNNIIYLGTYIITFFLSFVYYIIFFVIEFLKTLVYELPQGGLKGPLSPWEFITACTLTLILLFRL